MKKFLALMLSFIFAVGIWLTPNKEEAWCGLPDEDGALIGYRCTNITIGDLGDRTQRIEVWVPSDIIKNLDLEKCPDI